MLSSSIACFKILESSSTFVRVYKYTGEIILSTKDAKEWQHTRIKPTEHNIELIRNTFYDLNRHKGIDDGYKPPVYIEELGNEHILFVYDLDKKKSSSNNCYNFYIFEKLTGSFVDSIKIKDANLILPLSHKRLLVKIKNDYFNLQLYQLQNNKLVEIPLKIKFPIYACDTFHVKPNTNELYGYEHTSYSRRVSGCILESFDKIYVFNSDTFKFKKIIPITFSKDVDRRFINNLAFVNDELYAWISPEKRDEDSLKSLFTSNLKPKIYCLDSKENKLIPQFELEASSSLNVSIHSIKSFNNGVGLIKSYSCFFEKDYNKICLYNKSFNDKRPYTEYKFNINSIGAIFDDTLAICDATGRINLYALKTPSSQTKLFFKNVSLPKSLALNQEFPPHIVNIILGYCGLFSPQTKKPAISQDTQKEGDYNRRGYTT